MADQRGPIPVCDQCGRPHVTHHGFQACVGHLSRHNPREPGGPCTSLPMNGGTVCKVHGGTAPQVLDASRRNVALATAEKALQRLIPDDPTPVRNPIAKLALLAGEADEVRTGIVAKVNAATEVDEILAWSSLYERFLDRTARICTDLVKANYLERHAAIEAADATRVLGAVQGGLNLISDPALRREVAQTIAANMRALQEPA